MKKLRAKIRSLNIETKRSIALTIVGIGVVLLVIVSFWPLWPLFQRLIIQ